MKNATTYCLFSDIPDTPALAEMLEESPSRRCQFGEEKHIGFRPPVAGEDYALEANRLCMFSVELTKVVLPAKVVKRETDLKIAEAEEKHDRKLADAEKREIKETVRAHLLSQSHQVSEQVDVWCDRERSLLVIDASSEKKIEDILNTLRATLGTLRVVPLATQESAAEALTRWLGQGRPDPAHWQFSGSCKMVGREDSSTVTFDKAQLAFETEAPDAGEDIGKMGPTPEVEACLDQGRICTEARFGVEEVGEFVLTNGLVLKSIKPWAETPKADTDDLQEAKRLNYEAQCVVTYGLIAHVIDELRTYLGEASLDEEDLVGIDDNASQESLATEDEMDQREPAPAANDEIEDTNEARAGEDEEAPAEEGDALA
ncbi:recombination-associated protein RdgC [Halomonas sp. I5-271120]|uniref:recombination-associated protein RdgC n=1 Tax=Halomonas sp. I5-271120 TaxID=3061632 RepID=UPI002714FEED|nr:recombination-associated protein RdgC [Halomonas sp. I5-271120]